MPRNRDLESLTKAIRAIPAAVKAAASAAVDKGADELVARMKLLAPVADEQGGELRASIRIERGAQAMSATVTAGGPTTTRATSIGPFDYALGVEYGTRDTPAQPFFWISERTLRKRIKGRIDRAISKAVRSEWRK